MNPRTRLAIQLACVTLIAVALSVGGALWILEHPAKKAAPTPHQEAAYVPASAEEARLLAAHEFEDRVDRASEELGVQVEAEDLMFPEPSR